ncbi:hypothetical protein JCM10207_001930 [Rhodosporidiobolus poonsookiae]
MASHDPHSPISASNSTSELTVHDDASPTANLEDDAPGRSAKRAQPIKSTGLFTQPGTLPLPDHGHHHLGVVFEGVTVYGSGGTRKTVEDLPLAMLKMWDVPGFIGKLLNLKLGKKRSLISNFSGVVPAGETMLVLGRPGSGCSTLLRAIGNQRDSFAVVEGDVHYGRLDAKLAKKLASGEIVFNSEDDIHEPMLTVEQTLRSGLTLKKPHAEPVKRSSYASDLTSRLLNAFGMPHTARTRVGDAFVRGVSGGERKRVSLAEHLSTNAAVSCWDNSIRGLDSAVALQYIKILKELSLSTGMTNVVSIYQASQDAYAYFDRVAVLFEGELVFCGRAEDAQDYFEQQGWWKNPRQTTPDFLTSCTSVTERVVRKGHTGFVPQTPVEMAQYFRESSYGQKLSDDIASYKAYHASSDDTERFVEAVRKSKAPLAGTNNGYKTSFAHQTLQLMKVQFQLQLADPRDIIVRLAANSINALIVGSCSFRPTPNANGAFTVAGSVFFAILYFVIFAFGEIPPTVFGRPLAIKHRQLGFYNPAAAVFARLIADLPLYIIQTLLFSSLFYFLIGLNPDPKIFFTFWFVCFVQYSAMSACYRAIGAWSPNLSVAVRYGGFALSLMLSTAGFILPPPQQHGWAGWMRRIAPPAYALEALLANEFRTRSLTCAEADLVPNGPGYDDTAYQGCTIIGATPGSATVNGLDYLSAKYGFSPSNIWRNVGIIIAMYVIYSILVVIGSSLLVRDTGSASAKLFKRGAVIPEKLNRVESRKQYLQAERTLSRAPQQERVGEKDVQKNVPTFTFEDVRYTVQVDGKDKLLLDSVTGLVKPYALTALMGASGAGKTTLLDTVSQRKTTGVVEGRFLIDGKPLSPEFSRRCAFAMQADVHEPLNTVRECIQFSALLRQDASVAREEKLAYAEEVIELLELQPIADAIVGNPEIGGLGIEEKKRLTIAVELAAKPDFLLFLDEPTSGLDSDAAMSLVGFLKKIAATGMGILCTIHQPSGDLFELFDAVVLLAPQGKTVYAGPTGENAQTVTKYFARYGATIPRDANPAEFIIETVAPVGGAAIDWPQHWRESPEAEAMRMRIAEINAQGGMDAQDGEVTKPKRFAATFATQTKELIKRNFRAQWRNGSYHLTKLSSSVFFGLFVGFYYYKMPATLNGVQSLSLALLALTQICPPLALDIGANLHDKLDLFLARERNGIYSWQALVTSLLVVEVPVLLIAFNLLFFCSFWTIGYDVGISSVPAFAWLQWMVLALFLVTFGVLLGAVSPTRGSIPYVLSTLWITFNITSWTLVPKTIESSPYQYFASYLSPLRWFYGSVMSNHLGKRVVQCTAEELTVFNIPDGETCSSYLASFLETAAGYIIDGNATGSCSYCTMSTGQDYLTSIGYSWDHRWRDWGVFICFAVVNVFTCFGAIWFLRIRPLYKK